MSRFSSRFSLAMAAAATALLAFAHDASAFSIVNAGNYAQGGARVMMTNPDELYRQNLRDGSGFGGNNTRTGDGYGGLEIYDVTKPYGRADGMPSFPGADNHLSLGTNAGMLQYGAIPGR
jgi:hypothetical protein